MTLTLQNLWFYVLLMFSQNDFGACQSSTAEMFFRGYFLSYLLQNFVKSTALVIVFYNFAKFSVQKWRDNYF